MASSRYHHHNPIEPSQRPVSFWNNLRHNQEVLEGYLADLDGDNYEEIAEEAITALSSPELYAPESLTTIENFCKGVVDFLNRCGLREQKRVEALADILRAVRDTFQTLDLTRQAARERRHYLTNIGHYCEQAQDKIQRCIFTKKIPQVPDKENLGQKRIRTNSLPDMNKTNTTPNPIPKKKSRLDNHTPVSGLKLFQLTNANSAPAAEKSQISQSLDTHQSKLSTLKLKRLEPSRISEIFNKHRKASDRTSTVQISLSKCESPHVGKKFPDATRVSTPCEVKSDQRNLHPDQTTSLPHVLSPSLGPRDLNQTDQQIGSTPLPSFDRESTHSDETLPNEKNCISPLLDVIKSDDDDVQSIHKPIEEIFNEVEQERDSRSESEIDELLDEEETEDFMNQKSIWISTEQVVEWTKPKKYKKKPILSLALPDSCFKLVDQLPSSSEDEAKLLQVQLVAFFKFPSDHQDLQHKNNLMVVESSISNHEVGFHILINKFPCNTPELYNPEKTTEKLFWVTVPSVILKSKGNRLEIHNKKSYEIYNTDSIEVSLKSVVLCSISEVIEMVMKYHCSVNRTEGLVKDFIHQNKNTLDLLDPISGSLIRIPVRGDICTHLECFDLKNFLKHNRGLTNWKCPVVDCPNKCPPHSLEYDMWVASNIEHIIGGKDKKLTKIIISDSILNNDGVEDDQMVKSEEF